MNLPHSLARGVGLILLASICLASMDAIAKHLAETLPISLLVWVRYFTQFMLMLVFLWPRMRSRLFFTQRPFAMLVRGLLLLTITSLMIFGLHLMPQAEMTAIFFVAPLMVGVLGIRLLGEKLSASAWIATAIGFVGIVLIARPGRGLSTIGLFCALGAAVCFALYQLQSRQLSALENPVAMVFYTALVGTLGSALMLPLLGNIPAIGIVDAGLMLMLGLLGGIGHFLLTRAFNYAPASTLSPLTYAQLIWAILIGWWLWDHLPDAIAFAGMLMVVGSSMANVWIGQRQEKRLASDG